jgi:hypothetical protein
LSDALRTYGRDVSEFLVEAYLSRLTAPVANPGADDVSRAADQLSHEGKPVELVHSMFVPEDETCYFLFRAQSSDAVAEAARRCGLRFERLIEAMSDWTHYANADLEPQGHRE